MLRDHLQPLERSDGAAPKQTYDQPRTGTRLPVSGPSKLGSLKSATKKLIVRAPVRY